MKSSRLLPFAGITERPYDQAFLKDLDWYEIRPTYVQMSSLNMTQTHCTILGLFGQRYSTDPHIRVVEYHGKLYVEDGHHRLVEQALSHCEMTLARVLFFGVAP